MQQQTTGDGSAKGTMRSLMRFGASITVAIAAALGMLPLLGSSAFASGTSVSGVTGPSPSPATAGVTTATYTVGFTTSSSGALTASQGIVLTFPTGTLFPATATDYTVNSVAVSSLKTVSSGACTVTSYTVPADTVCVIVPQAIGASAAVTVVVANVTNPTKGTYTNATVATSSDTVPATVPSYVITPAPTSVTVNTCCGMGNGGAPAAGNPTPDFAGQAALYAASLTTSNTPTGSGALAAGTGTITVSGPTGIAFASTASDYVVNGVAASTVLPNGTSVTITTPVAVAAGGAIYLAMSGVTNPPATTSPNTDALTFSTSSDTNPVAGVTPDVFTILPAPTAVTGVVCCAVNAGNAVNGNPNPNGTSVTSATYGVGFTASATGALSTSSTPPGGIVLDAPSGTLFSTSVSNYTVNSVTAISLETVSGGTCTATTYTTPGNEVCILTPTNVGNSGHVNIVIANVTNPSTSSTSDTMTVSTTSDMEPVVSGNYTIYSTVTSVVVAASPNVAASPGVYSVDFTTSASGSLAAGSGTITIDAPSGTSFPAAASDYTVSDILLYNTSKAVPATTVSVNPAGCTSPCVEITTPVAIAASALVDVTINGVTNPAAGTYDAPAKPYFTVSTSADLATAEPGTSLTIVAATTDQVENAQLSVSDASANASGVTYSVSFTTSSATAPGNVTYNLVGGTSQIGITATSGTLFDVSNSATVTVNGQAATVAAGHNSDAITITSPVSVLPSAGVTVSIGDSTNPNAGNYIASLSTVTPPAVSGADTTAATTNDYVIGTPNESVAAISVTATPPYSGEAAQWVYTFHSGGFGELGAGAGVITLTGSAGVTFPSAASDYVVDGVVATTVSVNPAGCTAPCVEITTPVAIGGGAVIYVVINGMTNPTVTSPTNYTADVETSADPVAIAGVVVNSPTPPDSISPVPTSISGLAGPNPNPATVSATAQYTYTFDVSSATATGSIYNLVANTQQSWISITPDASTTLPSTNTDYVVNGLVVQSGNITGGGSAGTPVEIAPPVNVSPGGSVKIVVSGATNPGTPGTGYTDTIATTTDLAPSSTPAYTIGDSVSAISMPSGVNYPFVTSEPVPSNAGATGAEYGVKFTATTALTGGTDTITVVVGTGTTLPAAPSAYTVNGVAAPKAPVNGNSVTITTPVGVAASGTVVVVIAGVTNAGGGTYPVVVSTSQDTIPETLASAYTIGSEITNLTGPNPNPASVASNSTYTFSFVVSATGALSVAKVDTITLDDTSGATTFPNTAADYVVNSVASTGITAGGGSPSVTFKVPVNVAASGSVSLVVSNVTNPATGGKYSIKVNTSQDTSPVSTNTYVIGTAPGAVTVVANPAVGDETASYAIATSASSSGALAAGTGTITVTAPSGTVFPTAASDYVVDDTTSAQIQAASAVSGGGSDTVVITTPIAIANSDSFTIAISGVTNPDAGNYTLTVATSADQIPTTSSSYSLAAPPAPTVLAVIPTSGPNTGGTAVTISGANFLAGATVDFGANAATNVTVVNSTEVTATSPAGSVGVVDVTVTTKGGTSAKTSADQFTYVSTVPTVASISPTVGPTSGGTTVTVSGTNFVSGATVDFGTDAATGVTVLSPTALTAVSPAENTGVVDVTVTTAGGTSATSSADQFTYESAYTAVTPARICDTRSGNPSNLAGAAAQCSGKTLAANKALDVTVTGLANVPATGVSAVVVNVTAVNPAGNGYVTVFPAGATEPTASNLNFSKGDIVPNLVEVGVGTNGQISVESNAATDVLVDVEGYYSVPSSSGAGLYNALAPARICDTRSGNPSGLSGAAAQCGGKTLAANTPLVVNVAGVGPVPATGVAAVALNVTAIGTAAGAVFASTGYVSLYAAGGSAPTASNLNYLKGHGPVPNAVIVPVSSGGAIDVVSNAATNVAIDVVGYYSSAGGSGAQFNAEPAPARICDTRANNPSGLSGANAQCNGKTIGAKGTMTVNVASLAGVPLSATAVALNVTVVNTVGSGYLTVFPGGTMPTVSNLNWVDGEVVANNVIATLSGTGTISIYNSTGSDVIVDVLGWYL